MKHGTPPLATTLVIDDEAPIRRLAQRMLEPEVCRVIEAPDAETGLRLIERDEPRVDVVLTDWIMRGLNGLDILEVLHRHRPDLQVAVISGYTSTIHTVIRSSRGLQVLQKPFTAGEVGQAVTQMIASAAEIRRRAPGGRARRVRAQRAYVIGVPACGSRARPCRPGSISSRPPGRFTGRGAHAIPAGQRGPPSSRWRAEIAGTGDAARALGGVFGRTRAWPAGGRRILPEAHFQFRYGPARPPDWTGPSTRADDP